MKAILFVPLCLALALCGCRREDVREMTVVMPGAVKDRAAFQAKVTDAIKKYNGIVKDSYAWDYAADKTTLTLRYDSMQIAQANVRYAIDEAGVKVAFPEKTDDHAGH